MAIIEGEILTLEEVAVYLKAGKRTVYRLASNGQIPAFKLGGTWRFRRADLEKWIADQTGKTASAGDQMGSQLASAAAPRSGQARPTRRKLKG